MAGETEREAVQKYVEPLQRAVSCISKSVLGVSGGYRVGDTPHSLTFGDGLPQKLKGPNVYLSIVHKYRIVRDDTPGRGPWRVTIDHYVYTIRRSPSSDSSSKHEKLISYQWHPNPQGRYNYPHLHLYPDSIVGSPSEAAKLSSKSHIPTGRVAMEDIIRFVITQLNVQPLRKDWEKVLNETQERFTRYSSWLGSGPPSIDE